MKKQAIGVIADQILKQRASISLDEAKMMKWEPGILSVIKKYKGRRITQEQLEDALASEINDFEWSEAPMEAIIHDLKSHGIRVV